jgi:RNA polymerase sigma-70 factor, ECF subfamily
MTASPTGSVRRSALESDSRSGAPPGDATSTRRASFEISDELVARVRLGDDAAFERLVKIAFTPLWAFAVGFAESGEEAEDIVQDVLCRVWRMGVDWNPTGSARSYLYASVRNAAITARNRRALEARVHERTVLDGGPERTTVRGPDVMSEGDERAAAVWREVATLSERQRSALRLRYEEQLTVPEVAQVLGITVKAAEHFLSRTIQSLRKRLGAVPPDLALRSAAAPVAVVVESEIQGEPTETRATRSA